MEIKRDVKKPPRKLSVTERETMEEQNRHREDQLKDRESAKMVQDRGSLSRAFDKTKEILDADEEREAKGREKDRINSQNLEDKEWLEKNVPPAWLQKARPGTPEYQKAVAAGEKCNSDPEVMKHYERYQDGRRRLEPGNPMAGSIAEVITK